MRSIDKRNDPTTRTINASEIPVGTVFLGNVDDDDGREGPFLRTFVGIVSLSDPRAEWSLDSEDPDTPVDLPVTEYKPVQTEVHILADVVE